MSEFDQETLKHLKKLCRIECSPEEEADFAQGIKRILKHIEQLDEIDTSNVAPCRFVLRGMLKNRVREDEVKDLLPRDKFLANAPDQIGGMIRVPPIMKPSA
jgi:aspartyl-tRNA(Asn)/glutamyl-tRNA(Gln) amidotransferase subunit C